jgi:hypothetical protein
MLPSIVLTDKLIPFLLLMNHFEGTDKSLPFTALSRPLSSLYIIHLRTLDALFLDA